MIEYKSVVFKEAPTGLPVENVHFAVETRKFDDEAPPPKGGVTVQTYYASLDPYTRGRMREPDAQTWQRPFEKDQPIDSGAVSKVLKSDHADFKPEDIIWGLFPTEEYSRLSAEALSLGLARKLDGAVGFDWEYYTGVLGIAGLSAWVALYEYGLGKQGDTYRHVEQPKGKTIWVSSAAGAIGSLIGQLAKLEGMRVIGSVGTDEKLDYILQDLGFDAGFNYRKEKDLGEALKRVAPEGIDLYIDNVGGTHLEAAIDNMKDFGRIVTCGAISGYNLPADKRYGVKNLVEMFLKRLTMVGFIISDAREMRHVLDFFGTVPQLLIERKIKEPKHDVTVGIENAAQGFLALFSGDNNGKAVLKIADLPKS